MSVVGLDFGNQYAVIAAAGRGGVDVILNGNSNRLNASMIGFANSRSMGESAQTTATSNYCNTIRSMKRLIGLTYNEPRAQKEMKLLPFTCIPLNHANGGPESIGVRVIFNSEEIELPIEAVAGMFVKHMGELVASKSSESNSIAATMKDLFPKDWVITIPGFYTDAQRRALLNGCKIAGIDGIQRLMHEHTATALAYGIFKDIRKEFANQDEPTNVMFLDIGATSYSCSIVSFSPGKLIVRTAQFDDHLGGRDFDMKIAEWIAAKFEATFSGKLSGKVMERPKTVLKLLAAAEKAKKTLSPVGVKEARINLEMVMDDLDFNVVLTSTDYEDMCSPLLARLGPPIERALKEAGMDTKDLSSVEIVGGGSRVGCVKRALAKILGLDSFATYNGLSTTMNADEAVARGAALQSAILSPRFKVLPYEIIEAQPYPIKVSWEKKPTDEDGTNEVIMFDRNSNFNIVRRIALKRDAEFTIRASYDETAASSYGFPEGVTKDIVEFKIMAPAGSTNKVRINVKLDINGCICLSSTQMIEEVIDYRNENSEGKEDDKDQESKHASNEEAKVEKKKKSKKTNLSYHEIRPLEWTKSELDSANEKEVSMGNIDRLVKETADMRNELESYVYGMRDKISSETHLKNFATSDVRNNFTTTLEETENWLYEDGFDSMKSVYAQKLNLLQAIGNPIAQRYTESKTRPNAMSILQRTVEKYQNWLNSSAGDENYNHITEDEFKKCHDSCDASSSWMYEMMDKQGSLPAFQNPVVTTLEISAKTGELTNMINPIMHKPKPKPKPLEKRTEDKAEEEEKKAENKRASSEPMETDVTSATDKGGEESEPMDTS